MVQILAEPLYPPTQRWPWLPSEIDAWFARSCTREGHLRFRSAGAQIDALGEALGVNAQAFAETHHADVRPALAPPPIAFRSGAPTLPIVGASTTTRPHAVGDTGAPLAPPPSTRSRLVPFTALALVATTALVGGAWVVERRAPASLSAPSAASGPPLASASAPPPPVVPSESATQPAASGAPDAAAAPDASARPPRRPSQPWNPPAATPTPPSTTRPFEPVSP
jgi:hypothetical protein